MFNELRQQAASAIKEHLAGPAYFTPAGTLDTIEVPAIFHEARKDNEDLSLQVNTATLFASDVGDMGKVGDSLVNLSTGSRFLLDTPITVTPTHTVWALKTARAR